MDPNPQLSRATVSAETAQLLLEAMQSHALSSDDILLRQALRSLCAEARTRALSPEALVIAMKRAWTMVPQPLSISDDAWSRAYYTALSTCLSAYFAPSE